MSSKVPIRWLIPSLTANTRSQWCRGFCALPGTPGVLPLCGSNSRCCNAFWKRWELCCPLAPPVRWEEQSTPYMNSVLPTGLLPRWGQAAGSLSIPPLALVRGRASVERLCANTGHGQGVSRQRVTGPCLVATKTCQSGLLLYLAQTSLFESRILSSSGIIISSDNINSNNSSLLQPIPFPSIRCANGGRRVKCSLLLWPGCHLHLPSALHCSISKPFVSLW